MKIKFYFGLFPDFDGFNTFKLYFPCAKCLILLTADLGKILFFKTYLWNELNNFYHFWVFQRKNIQVWNTLISQISWGAYRKKNIIHQTMFNFMVTSWNNNYQPPVLLNRGIFFYLNHQNFQNSLTSKFKEILGHYLKSINFVFRKQYKLNIFHSSLIKTIFQL